MRRILSDIRALPGVTGVAVIGKRSSLAEHVFPASFSDRHVKFLRDLVYATHQRLRGFTRLSLRFERVIVHLYNQPEFLLFVTTLPDTDSRQFEMVVNSKFGAIARVLDASPPPAQANAPNVALSRTGGAAHASVDGDSVILRLMSLCNLLSDQLAESRGRVRVASDWRSARDAVKDGSLNALTIDPAGRLQIRKGGALTANAAVMHAFAQMITAFFEGLGAERIIAEEEFYALLKPHRSQIEPSGFFLYLEQQTNARA